MKRPWALLAACVMGIGSGIATAASITGMGTDESSGASLAVVVEGHALAHTGQLLPLDQEGNLVGGDSVDAQLAQLLFNLESALAAAGSTTDQLVKLNLYVDSAGTAEKVRGLFAKRFRPPARPAMLWVCTRLPHPEAKVGLDAVAAVPGNAPSTVDRKRCQVLAGDGRLADIAVLPWGDAVYVCGINGPGDSAAAETTGLVTETIRICGLDDRQVVQVKAFLPSMENANAVKSAIAAAFPNGPAPPLVLVEGITKTPIELELVAVAPPGRRAPTADATRKPSAPRGVKMAWATGEKRVYFSGLYAEKPGDAAEEVRNILGRLRQLAAEAGTDLRLLVKTTCCATDESAGELLGQEQAKYCEPTRSPLVSSILVNNVGMARRCVAVDAIGTGK